MAPVTSSLLAALAGLPNLAEPCPGGYRRSANRATAQSLQGRGRAVVVDNRDPMEPRPFDEPATVHAAGLEYISLPIVHGAVTTDTMKQMHQVLKRLEERSVLHCSSGNRTAAALIPYMMIEKKMEQEDAVDLAMSIGLRSAELMEVAVQYAGGLSDDRSL